MLSITILSRYHLIIETSPLYIKQGQTVHNTAIDRERETERQKGKQQTENKRDKQTDIQRAGQGEQKRQKKKSS